MYNIHYKVWNSMWIDVRGKMLEVLVFPMNRAILENVTDEVERFVHFNVRDNVTRFIIIRTSHELETVYAISKL